jgi:two-component system sensor histidine kinase KdpD
MAISLGVVGLVTAAYYLAVQVNPTTIALSYVVIILLIAMRWGIAESTTASLGAVLCFNFFFLPPVGTLTIADPQNWVALVAFLLTAIITSQLSGRARRRHMDALTRQRDLERLYVLSRALLLSERGVTMPGQMASHIADAFALQTVGVYDQRTDTVSWAGARDWPEIDARLRDIARRAGSVRDQAGFIIIAIQLGGAPIGSVAVADTGLSDTVLHSIANLAAIGLERARASEATARAEAARESSELRATVLDALAHEFKTPLTSMKAASSNLLASRSEDLVTDRELIAIIDEDLDRLSALVTDAVQMLRIDAGDFVVHLERLDVEAVIAGALRRFQRQLDGHDLITRVPEGLTVDADRELLALALRQLLDNALKYSPATSTIQIEARANGAVEITIRNSGSAIPDREQPRIVERFYRGTQARRIPGTGMGLAIVRQIAGAHHGTLTLVSSADAGTAFTLSLPRGGRTS